MATPKAIRLLNRGPVRSFCWGPQLASANPTDLCHVMDKSWQKAIGGALRPNACLWIVDGFQMFGAFPKISVDWAQKKVNISQTDWAPMLRQPVDKIRCKDLQGFRCKGFCTMMISGKTDKNCRSFHLFYLLFACRSGLRTWGLHGPPRNLPSGLSGKSQAWTKRGPHTDQPHAI